MRFEGQVVVITGASRGIGREIAISFAAEGAKVACVATTDAGAEGTAEVIRGMGHEARGYGCNISESSQVDALIDKIVADFSSISVLVNNAGVTQDGLMLRMKDEDWERVIDTNLNGTFFCIRAVSRVMMRERYGRIINLASVIGLHGAAGQANYAASKAGIIGLTMSVAKEFGSRNITCNAVAPGFIVTDMTDSLPDEFKKHVEKNSPAGRLGTAADVSPAVLFLASKEAGYITGQTLTVDGGLMI